MLFGSFLKNPVSQNYVKTRGARSHYTKKKKQKEKNGRVQGKWRASTELLLLRACQAEVHSSLAKSLLKHNRTEFLALVPDVVFRDAPRSKCHPSRWLSVARVSPAWCSGGAAPRFELWWHKALCFRVVDGDGLHLHGVLLVEQLPGWSSAPLRVAHCVAVGDADGADGVPQCRRERRVCSLALEEATQQEALARVMP